MYFWPKLLAFLTVRWKINSLCRTRTCNPKIQSLVPYSLGYKATLIFVFRLISRPSTFQCQIYWTHPYQRYSNRYSKFLIIPHGLSVEECYSALAPYQGNVFLHWLSIRGKSFCFFGSVSGEILSALAHKEKVFLHWLSVWGKSLQLEGTWPIAIYW